MISTITKTTTKFLHVRFFSTIDPLRNSQVSLAPQSTSSTEATQLINPHEWFPMARQMRRKIIFHGGPTNSGKTHRAIEALKKSHSGVYCGPLRLLAWEIFERLNQDKIPCNLMTGQEAEEVPDAQVLSCTTEMVDVNKEYDVAVVDEIQLIGDRDRGWAWTRALLGIPAREIHLCGEPAALPIIERLCADTGDELIVHNYKRLSPLSMTGEAIQSLEEVRPGDAVIAFSRRELFYLKRQIESLTGANCCIVYGALPPEVRRQQARLFNDLDSPNWSIIVATDVIGMGLNLNIGRVVFSTLRKYDGISERPLVSNEMKQIGGRAGRYGSQYPTGSVTCLEDDNANKDWICQTCSAVVFERRTQCFRCNAPRLYKHDTMEECKPQGDGDAVGMDFIRKQMESENADLLTAGLAPTEEHLYLFAQASSVLHLLVPANQTNSIAMVEKDVKKGLFDDTFGSVVTVSKRTTNSKFESRQDYETARTKTAKNKNRNKDSIHQKGVYRVISVSGSPQQLRQTVEYMLGRFQPEDEWHVAIPTSKLKEDQTSTSTDASTDELDVQDRLQELSKATEGCNISLAPASITSGIPGTTVLRLEGTQMFGVLEGIGTMCEGKHALFTKNTEEQYGHSIHTYDDHNEQEEQDEQDEQDEQEQQEQQDSDGKEWNNSLSKWSQMLTSDNDATIDLPAGPTNGNGIIAIERDMLDIPFSHMLISFHRAVTLDSDKYHMMDVTDMIKIAKTIDHIAVALETRFTLCRAPLNLNNKAVLDKFIEYTTHLSKGEEVRFELDMSKRVPSTPKDMEGMEKDFKVIECYLWMARRFPEQFPDEEKANTMSVMFQEMMEDGLKKLSDEDAAKFAYGKKKKNKNPYLANQRERFPRGLCPYSMCAYWKRGFNQPTTVEPMKYMVPNDHVRLNSYDVPFNAANLGQGNGRRRGQIDPKKTFDNYKKRSETYLKNMREKRKREFLQVGTSTISPRLPSQQVFIQEPSQPLPTISSNDPIDPSLSTLSSSNQEYISATPVEDSLSSIVRETQMPTPRINTPQNNQQPEQQLLSQPPPPSTSSFSYDQLKQTMIRQLLDEGANEETIYQALSRLEQARRRKQDQPNQQSQQQQSTSAKTTLNNQYEPASIPLKSSYIPPSTSAPATIDVFNLSSHPISPRDRYKTRRHFNTSKHMTGLIGPDSISNIRKKLISPRDNIEGGSGGHYRELIPQYKRTNRKRPIENQTNRLYQAKNWTDVSGYPSELPPSRSPRNSKKKESPRAHNQFGQKRVLFDAQTNNQKIGYQFNSLTSGPQKRKDGYSSRQFSERKKGYSQSMAKWETTQAVSTLMVKPSGSSDVEY